MELILVLSCPGLPSAATRPAKRGIFSGTIKKKRKKKKKRFGSDRWIGIRREKGRSSRDAGPHDGKRCYAILVALCLLFFFLAFLGGSDGSG